MRTTFMAKANEVERKWYVVDAEGQTLGRLASEVASILRGKTNLHLHHTLTRVINVVLLTLKIHLTGNKLNDKIYYRHTNHPGGLKQEQLLKCVQTTLYKC